MKEKINFGSICVKEAKFKGDIRSHQMPLYATSSFEFDTIDQGIDIFTGKEKGLVYGRYANPNTSAVADKVARMEMFGLEGEATALLTSSGMSAISTLVSGVLSAGDKILTQGNLYGGTTEFFVKVLGRFGIETIFTNLQDLEHVEDLLKKDSSIKALYFETPANPTLACVDIESLASLGKKYAAYSIIDNTFPTPYLQQPFKFGVDFIIHSSTKYLNGHGNSISGVIIGRDQELMEGRIWQVLKLAGTNASPFEAWLLNNGMRTLELRMDRHCQNAQEIAEYLEQHSKVATVNYNGLASHPDHEMAKKQMSGFGGMLSFELKGGLDAGLKFMNSIEFCTLAPTLGDVDTLVLHPASSSHINVAKEMRERNGITDGLIRLSVGIESVADIIADLEQGMK
ncbi:MAG: methionine-gamma-lyase [Maribacter sp.]|jgi:methionine-gamma-lyase